MTPLPWCAVADAIVAVTTLMVTADVDGTEEKSYQEQDKSWTHETQEYVNEMKVSETLHRKIVQALTHACGCFRPPRQLWLAPPPLALPPVPPDVAAPPPPPAPPGREVAVAPAHPLQAWKASEPMLERER